MLIGGCGGVFEKKGKVMCKSFEVGKSLVRWRKWKKFRIVLFEREGRSGRGMLDRGICGGFVVFWE